MYPKAKRNIAQLGVTLLSIKVSERPQKVENWKKYNGLSDDDIGE